MLRMFSAHSAKAILIAALLSVVTVGAAIAQETQNVGKPSEDASSEMTYSVTVNDRRMTPPRAIVRTDPTSVPFYAEGSVGNVVFEAEIGIDGKVRNVHKISGSAPEELERHAAQVIKDEWKFKPAEVDGRPVVVLARIEIKFKARQGSAAQEKSTAPTNDTTGRAVYRFGDGITPPRALQTPDPQFTREARKAHTEGTVVLKATVGVDGRAHDVQVVRSLDPGLDANAKQIVEQEWRFRPGEKEGKPVPVAINIEVNFHLYDGPLNRAVYDWSRHAFVISSSSPDFPIIVTSGNSYPEYPKSALGSKTSGTVFLEATVGTNGKPRDIEIIKRLSPELDEEAKRLVEKKWRFQPERQHGNEVTSRVRIAIHFDANDPHPKTKRAEAALLPYKVQ